MRHKRSLRYSLMIAYIKRSKNPTKLETFAINHIRSKYIWAFCR